MSKAWWGVSAPALNMQPEALNRGTIKLLLVHRRARRKGVGKKLLAELEKSACARQRGVLSLEVRAGSGAEAFYRSQGYRCLGKCRIISVPPTGTTTLLRFILNAYLR